MASPKNRPAILAAAVAALACATEPPPAAEMPAPRAAAPAPVVLHARYEVAPGDTLSLIAQDHGVTLAALLAENPTDDPRKLEIGRVLRVPVAGSQQEAPDFDDGSAPARAEPAVVAPAIADPAPVADPATTHSAPIAELLDQAQQQRQDEQYSAALETLARADRAAAEFPKDEDSRSKRAQIALMAATVELGRGDDAGAVRRFGDVLTLLPHYAPEPGAFSPHALELLEQARGQVAVRR